MYLWILALIVMASVAVVGFYQGALRAAFSFVGLLVAALLAKSAGVLFNFILPAVGVSHPAVLDFLSPVLGFILVLGIFKGIALAVHKKVDTWYKYKASDTQRLLWERVNSRLGIAVGLANGAIYLYALATLFYAIGYFTYQMASTKKESWSVAAVNRLAKDIETTGMAKSIAPFNPASEVYFDSSDILADIFHTPLLQNRLANYPPFLALGDQPEFKGVADAKLQESWATGMSLREFAGHERIRPLVENRELFTNVLAIVRPDLKDLKTYLATGTSPKYDDEKILGRWAFNFRASVSEARRRKANIGSAELTRLRALLAAQFNKSTFVGLVNGQAVLKRDGNKPSTQGTWKSAGDGSYILNVTEDNKASEIEAKVDGKRLILIRGNIAAVFENLRV